MRFWHPHTEQPEGFTSVLIALPPEEPTFSEDRFHCLACDIYEFHPDRGFVNSDSDEPIRHQRFFWAHEADVLRELDEQLKETHA